jgi:hypothetical protein
VRNARVRRAKQVDDSSGRRRARPGAGGAAVVVAACRLEAQSGRSAGPTTRPATPRNFRRTCSVAIVVVVALAASGLAQIRRGKLARWSLAGWGRSCSCRMRRRRIAVGIGLIRLGCSAPPAESSCRRRRGRSSRRYWGEHIAGSRSPPRRRSHIEIAETLTEPVVADTKACRFMCAGDRVATVARSTLPGWRRSVRVGSALKL